MHIDKKNALIKKKKYGENMQTKSFRSYKKIYFILAISFILSICCITKIIMPNETYYYSNEVHINSETPASEITLYDSISLPIGVYDIQLYYETDSSFTHVFDVRDYSVRADALQTNACILHKNLEQTNFRIWLFENTDALEVYLSYGGVGYVTTGELHIQETDALWTMSLFIILTTTLILLGILYYKYRTNDLSKHTEQKFILFGLFVIAFIASIPFLQNSVFSTGDLTYHLNRIEGVKDGLLSGQFPIRIEPRWLHDHGYANSIFYCNTLLYFPAILRLLGFNISIAYNAYCIMINIATTAIAYYCFSKIFKDRYIGLMGSALYTLSVFRFSRLLISGVIGEVGAMAFLPLVIYGLYRAFSEDIYDKKYKTTWIPIAVGYTGIIQTHVLTCEITALLTLITCLLFIKKIFRKQTFWELFKGAGVALLLCLWYLVPFLDYYINEDLHIHYVSGRTIQHRGLYLPQLFFTWWELGNNAMYGDLGMFSAISNGVGLFLGIVFALFCILWFSNKLRSGDKTLILGKYACIFSGILMLFSLNIFPWDDIQKTSSIAASLVSSLQFPFRFLGWSIVFLIILFGCLITYFKTKQLKFGYHILIIGSVLSILVSSLYHLDSLNHSREPLKIYTQEGMGFGYISGKEYLLEGTSSDTLDFGVPVADENTQILGYDKSELYYAITCTNNTKKLQRLCCLFF